MCVCVWPGAEAQVAVQVLSLGQELQGTEMEALESQPKKEGSQNRPVGWKVCIPQFTGRPSSVPSHQRLSACVGAVQALKASLTGLAEKPQDAARGGTARGHTAKPIAMTTTKQQKALEDARGDTGLFSFQETALAAQEEEEYCEHQGHPVGMSSGRWVCP